MVLSVSEILLYGLSDPSTNPINDAIIEITFANYLKLPPNK